MRDLHGDILLIGSEFANFGYLTFVCHQVCVMRELGPVLGQRIGIKYPLVERDYSSFGACMGDVLIFNVEQNLLIAFLVAQKERQSPTDMDSLIECLRSFSQYLSRMDSPRVLFPRGMGCVRGAAEWDLVEDLIDTTLRHVAYVYKVGWPKTLR